MKTLLLLRHAKSSWKDDTISDIDRPLKSSGVRNAIEVSEKLKSLNIMPDLIISSPAVRAVSTALIFARTLKYDYSRISINEMVYDFGLGTLLRLVQNIDDKYNVVMLVGHDPAITFLLNELADVDVEKLTTASVASVSFKFNQWKKIMPGNGKLVFLESPAKEQGSAAE